MYFYLCPLGFSICYAVCSFVSLWWVCLICIICMALHVVARDQLWRLINWGYTMGRLYDIVSRLLTMTWWKRRCWSPALITLTMLDLCNNLKYYLYDYKNMKLLRANNPIYTDLSLYRGGQFYWLRKPEKTTDMSQATDKLYHIMLCWVYLACEE